MRKQTPPVMVVPISRVMSVLLGIIVVFIVLSTATAPKPNHSTTNQAPDAVFGFSSDKDELTLQLQTLNQPINTVHYVVSITYADQSIRAQAPSIVSIDTSMSPCTLYPDQRVSSNIVFISCGAPRAFPIQSTLAKIKVSSPISTPLQATLVESELYAHDGKGTKLFANPPSPYRFSL